MNTSSRGFRATTRFKRSMRTLGLLSQCGLSLVCESISQLTMKRVRSARSMASISASKYAWASIKNDTRLACASLQQLRPSTKIGSFLSIGLRSHRDSEDRATRGSALGRTGCAEGQLRRGELVQNRQAAD